MNPKRMGSYTPPVARIGEALSHTEWRYAMFDVERLMKVMSEILSDKYGVKVTMTAVPKEEAAA